ncbi:diaminopimelate epimerase [Halorubrum vacuolatum]|uniref:Diaminopimelate epimerase n=1 Tax=Halorubrum vacuolatum TaxID=63740 RepID=A0A238VMZ6_HALVU|nr:diaminopimelate epimerase [Halorubrum vacuolatum]SNR35742.1 diaminopimelate epimerase [Halorubrum vacuolatum]
MSTHAVPIEKYHGTGNDFVVVDTADGVGDRSAFAEAYCDRETGVDRPDFENDREREGTASDATGSTAGRRGADGVLFLKLETQYRPTRVVMTLVQPDGSTAAMCGNGARVVARWAYDRTGEREFMIDTQAGTRRATVSSDGKTVTIEMGVPRFEAADIPLTRDGQLIEEDVAGLTVTAVNTGVPHAVAFVEDVDAVSLDAVAPPVRHADVFAAGANVNLATVVEDGHGSDTVPAIAQRTFERGVEGETRSCGTGAVAIAAVARRLGLVDGETIRVRPPGGELAITVPAGGSTTMTGPVTHEFSGTLPADPR